MSRTTRAPDGPALRHPLLVGMCLVTVSKSSSASKKSSAKSNHHLTTKETTTSPPHAHSSAASTDAIVIPTAASATTADSAVATEATVNRAPSAALTSKVIAQLDAIEASLGLDIVIRPKEKSQIGSLNRVSDTAIGLASDIVSAAPARFPDFTDLPQAAAYVKSVGQVASRATELATHIQNSVLNQRAPAATKTLALYAVVKGLGRIVDNQTMREKVTALKAEVAPKIRNPKPKITKGQKTAARVAKASTKRVAKATKVLTAAGLLPVATPSAASNATSDAATAATSATPETVAVIVTPTTPVAGH